MKPIKTTLSVAAALAMGTAALAETPVLTVMTYDSFVSDWGPGPGDHDLIYAQRAPENRNGHTHHNE